MGDAFPRLDPRAFAMEQERALLSPVFDEHARPPSMPALVVHVEIQFTDPVIRSRYCRSYGSSPGFHATNRICRGLVRRIERCSEELLTRKDSGALEIIKDGSYERKPQRFEMTFRVMRRGQGEWAERTYRSYQKQPLTVDATKDIILASHRIVGLFLRRHDQDFQWLNCPIPDADSQRSETIIASRDSPLSLLSVPRSRFIEATQEFEFVPGYAIELCFRSKNPRRRRPLFERRIRVSSTQTTPLTLFMSEDLLWKALQALNQGLDTKKQELDDRLRETGREDDLQFDQDALEIDLRVTNNLGPVYKHVHRNVKSRLALFRDMEARDCEEFLRNVENLLISARNEADAKINALNDLEIRIVELKGVGWSVREPAKFTLGPSASYGRRTIQAVLDRIQAGIADIIRGHNVAIHITAYKRGHLVLDKAIVAHEKHGKPIETFPSAQEAQSACVSRLKARIQQDMDKVLDDSCAIDDIPEDEHDDFVRPLTPAWANQALTGAQVSPGSPPSSPMSLRSGPTRTATSPMQTPARPRIQRVFSLSRRSSESVRSIDYLRRNQDSNVGEDSRPNTAASERNSSQHPGGQTAPEDRAPLIIVAEVKPAQRSFPLVSKTPETRAGDDSAILVAQQAAENNDREACRGGHNMKVAPSETKGSFSQDSMTSSEAGESFTSSCPGSDLAESFGADFASDRTGPQATVPSQNDNDAGSNVLPPGRRTRPPNMDTPEAFVDAREYAASPACDGMLQPEIPSPLTRGTSPRYDEYSTAPSTPELSTGGSSPRHSILITPTYIRTEADFKEPAAAHAFYPESEPEEPGHPAPDDYPISDSKFGPLLQPVAAASKPAAQRSDVDESVDAPCRGVAASPEPMAEAPHQRQGTPDGKPSTPMYPYTSPFTPFSESDTTKEQTVSDCKDLGAEFNAGSVCRYLAPAPDFPTSEVRGSEPNEALDTGSIESRHEELVNPGEASVSDEPGIELGTAAVAGTEAAQDIIGGDGPEKVPEVLIWSPRDEQHGAEPAAVPSDSNVEGGISLRSPEDSVEGDAKEEEAPRSNAGPESANDTRHDVGNYSPVDGAGLVADELEQQQQPVTEDVRDGDGVDVQTPGVSLDEEPLEKQGPSSDSEVSHAEPEDGTSGTVAEVVDEDQSTSKIEADASGTDAAVDNLPPKPEPDITDPSTALTGAETKEDGDLDVERDATADGAETEVEYDNDVAVGTAAQDTSPEASGTAPESGDTHRSDGANDLDELITVPFVADGTAGNSTEPHTTSEAVDLENDRIESSPVPSATDAAEPDTAESPVRDEFVEQADDSVKVWPGSESVGMETITEPGETPQTFEEQLAEEVEVRADETGENAPDLVAEILEPDNGEVAIPDAGFPSERSIDAALESKEQTFAHPAATETSSQLPEVQDGDISAEKEELRRVTESQTEDVDGNNNEDAESRLGMPIGGQFDNSVEQEAGKDLLVEVTATEAEVEIPDLPTEDEQPPAAAPAIPAESAITSASALVENELDDSGTIPSPSETSLRPSKTEVPASKPSPRSQAHYPPLAPVPIPDISLLSATPPPPPPQTSFSSSTRDSDTSSFISRTTSTTTTTTTARDSIDTLRLSTDLVRPPSPSLQSTEATTQIPPLVASRPPTAGYLGLHGESTRCFAGIKLHAAGSSADGDGDATATARRRLSLPLYMLDHHHQQQQEQQQAAALDNIEFLEGCTRLPRRSAPPASEAGWGSSIGKGWGFRNRHQRKEQRTQEETGNSDNERANGHGNDDGGEPVLPKMMLLLAGAVAIGNIMKRASI
ncbi:hypothetical protein N656DRAFT_794680 [Canariomyces notabilis]|uniref:Uncharacterized protein n=1 Tax=Canariomyces notabilis TaxID=2074819 RepID=A0AAN6YW82_9PEZI|nr:hypothetical protein N656DRAFT_794680 [Canariomyces arenarius]